MNHGSGLILTTSDGPVSVLTLNRPSRRNALNRDMLLALEDALAQVRMDARVSVVVLTGAGSSFCAPGWTQATRGRRSFYQPPQQIERLYQENGQGVVRALQSLPQVTVAAVNGPAIGWGACLATCSDFRVVAAEAFFRIPEIGLGMYYDVGCLCLLALVGPARAKRMTMLGDDIDAVEALRTGLADHVVSATDLMTAVDRVARSLLCRDSAAQRNAKRRVHGATIGRRRPLGFIESELTAAY